MGRPSRNVYKPSIHEEGVYLHVYNHCVESGTQAFPFGDVEKEKFLKHLKRTMHLYAIECISAVVMSNHFHLILYVPKKGLTQEEMFSRIQKFRKQKIVFAATDSYCLRRQELSNDLSSFMKEVQQGFTCWYNKTRPFRRRGTLWEQRFKCTKLSDLQALSTCLQYVELNPVRAEIVADPGQYRFSTYGIWQQSGFHPFKYSFEKHMVAALRPYLNKASIKGLNEYFRSRFEEICQPDISEVCSVELNRERRSKNKLLTRSRFWIDSLVLGSKISLREHAIRLWGTKRGERKRFGRVLKEDGLELMSIRQLIVDT